MFYLTMHSTHFIYGYMASDIWLRTILIVRKETRCRHIGYSYRLTARILLYAPSHRQDNTYHGLCYTSLFLVVCGVFLQVCFISIEWSINCKYDELLIIPFFVGGGLVNIFFFIFFFFFLHNDLLTVNKMDC